MPKSDPDLCHENMKLAETQREPDQPIVYVHVEKIKPARSRLVRPQLEVVLEQRLDQFPRASIL